MQYAIVDNQSIVVEVRTIALPNGAVLVPEGTSVMAGKTMLDENGNFVKRPVSPIPTQAGNVITIPACPLDTEVKIFDMNGNEKMFGETTIEEGWTDDFIFDTPGTYQFIIQAPFPHLQTVTDFEVTDADINP